MEVLTFARKRGHSTITSIQKENKDTGANWLVCGESTEY